MYILLVYERELSKNDYHKNTTNNNYKKPQKEKKSNNINNNSNIRTYRKQKTAERGFLQIVTKRDWLHTRKHSKTWLPFNQPPSLP